MAFDNKKPLGEQIDWADIAEKLLGGFNRANMRSTGDHVSSEGRSQALIAMGELAQALETIVKRQETELGRGTRVPSK